MSTTLSPSAQKVQNALKSQGLPCDVLELPASARTAKDAAQAIGCGVEQIVKSLIFRSQQSNRPVLVVASGGNRVNEQIIGELLAEPIAKADANFVRNCTGFAIGGVPPVAHIEQPVTFIDEDLLQYDVVWAAAGTPHAVFPLTPADLQTMTGGQVVSIK